MISKTTTSPVQNLAPVMPDLEITREVLLDRAHARFGSIPSEFIVNHLLRVTSDADWPVQREGMEALIRRMRFARRDDLRVASRPHGGKVLGAYTVRRKRARKHRPYGMVLAGLDPLSASCDCPDYLRNSLGLCKHLLAVLEDIARRPRKFEKARTSTRAPASPFLDWHPVRALSGSGDCIEQIRLREGGRSRGRTSQTARQARRWFGAELPDGSGRALNAGHPLNLRRRHALVRDLLAFHRGRAAAVNPALRRLLEDELARLEERRRNESQVVARRKALGTLGRKLYPFQRESVEHFFKTGRLVIADDMGLGKTIQAIACAQGLFRTQRIRRGLVLCPSSLKPQWQREWQRFSDMPVRIVEGYPEARRESYDKTQRGFLITNYEQLLRDLELVTEWSPDLVVLDEAQRIKNWATKTAHTVKELRPPYRLVLTGTPFENRLEELASIVEWVDDRALEPKWRLLPWHTLYVDGDQLVGGARNLDTLRTRLSGCMVRRVREEVLKQLPPRTDTMLTVPMIPAQRERHDELQRPIQSLVRITEYRPLTQEEFLKLMRLLNTQRIIANGLAQLDFADVWPSIEKRSPTPPALERLSSPKLIEFRELIEALLAQERRVVVFSQWRRALQLAHWAIGDLLEARSLRASFFTGREGQKRRTQNIVEFHDDPNQRILFATDSGGTGLNLQKAASCCINFELPWNPAVIEQRIGRIYRIGQKYPVDVYNLVAPDSIEGRIVQIVGDKRALFRGLFDGQSDEVLYEKSESFAARVGKTLVEEGSPGANGTHDEEDDPAVERELDELLNTADESLDPPADEPSSGGVAPVSPEGVRELFAGVRLRPRPDGGLSIDASREAASTLAALFEGMANLLKEAGERE